MDSKTTHAMENKMLSPETGRRKPYEAPCLKKRTSGQGILFLTGHAYIGDEAANDLLRLIFPESMEFKRVTAAAIGERTAIDRSKIV
jgi:hypothetical protein